MTNKNINILKIKKINVKKTCHFTCQKFFRVFYFDKIAI